MWITLLLPVLCVSLVGALSVLVYSLQKSLGPIKLPSLVRAKTQQTEAPVTADSDPGELEAQRPETNEKKLSPHLVSQIRRAAPVTSMAWHQVSVRVRGDADGPPKLLLKNISGVAVPGDMVALLGPSGAGKSTLLDTLAMQLPEGTVTGDITVNGQHMSRTMFRSISTYVPQEDVFIPTLSVWETLAISTRLRLPGRLGAADRDSLMEDSLRSMGLHKKKLSQVGGLLPGGLNVRGLSGGEKRRLSIACGVVAAPRIVFLDEPTSGLDSNAALIVMECMGALAAQQRIVVASIHQPRAAIWELFDKAQVLSEGHMLYFGPTDKVVDWFCGGLDYEYTPAIHGSQPEWLADLISTSFDKPLKTFKRSMQTRKVADLISTSFDKPLKTFKGSMQTRKDVERAAAAFAKEAGSYGCPTERPTLEGAKPPEPLVGEAAAKKPVERRFPTSGWTQYLVLQGRSIKSYTRNPANVAGRSMMSIVLGIIGGLVFYNRGVGSAGVQQDFSALFFITMILGLLPFTYMSMFVHDRQFFTVDPARSLYNVTATYASNMVANSILTIVNAGIFMLLMYALIGLRFTAEAVIYSALIACLHSLGTVQVLVMSAYLTPNQDMAFVTSVSYVTLGSVVAGFLCKISNMIGFLRVISYASIYRYTLNAFVQIQYRDRDDGCGLTSDPQYQAQMQQSGETPQQAGRAACQSIITNNDMTFSVPYCVLGMFVLLLIYHAGSYLALVRLRMKTRA